MDRLTGPQLKFAAAHTKIDELQTALVAFAKEIKSDGFTNDKDSSTGDLVFRFRVTKPTTPDPNWSIQISEIAHLLRSCLDNLAWQLALLNTKEPFRKTEYPIFLNRRSKDSSAYIPDAIMIKPGGRAVGKLQSILSKHRAMMEKTQPYHRRKHREQDPLWILHEMNNADKHKDIHFTNVAQLGNALQFLGGAPSIIAQGLTFRTGVPFEDGAEFLRIKSIISASSVKINPRYSINICFDGNCPTSFANLPVIRTISRIEARVKEILDMFVMEFANCQTHPLP